jgi:hypothetical protein
MGTSSLDPINDGEMVFGDRTRRMVARVLRQAPRTNSGLEPALRRREGSFRGAVRKLVDWDVLRKAPGSTTNRAIYAFNPAWSAALNDSIRQHDIAQLTEHGELVLVPTQDLIAASRVISRLEEPARPLWAMRFGNSDFGMLLVFESDVDEHAALRAFDALRAERIGCMLVEVRSLLDPSTLITYCESLGVDPSTPSLPSGSGA